jgi:hypothetical protein
MCDAASQPIKVARRKPSPQAKVYQIQDGTFTKVLPEQATTSELISHGYGIATVTIDLQGDGGKIEELKENLDGVGSVMSLSNSKVGI